MQVENATPKCPNYNNDNNHDDNDDDDEKVLQFLQPHLSKFSVNVYFESCGFYFFYYIVLYECMYVWIGDTVTTYHNHSVWET